MKTEFITLGAAGGPTPKLDRAQPAHVIKRGDNVLLVDCGEGAFRQLRKANIDLRTVHHVFISHHHFDHIGSLFACLGLNMMLHRKTQLTIYGPAGTKAILDGLLAACDVPHSIGFGVAGQTFTHPREFVSVKEVAPSDEVIIDDITITFCENTHYRTEEQFGQDGPLSLALRFDAPDRSIVFTGDTGPCEGLTSFASGAQLLVGELIDVETTMARVKAKNPSMPQDRLDMMAHHIEQHHLRPEELGKMAASAGVTELVAVHLPFDQLSQDDERKISAMIASEFSGTIAIGEDLGRY